MRANDERHGTPAGWQTHHRHGEEPCAPCRAAWAAKCATRRLDPELREIERQRQYAADRARRRLAHTHADEYAALYAEECAGLIEYEPKPPTRDPRAEAARDALHQPEEATA